MATLSFSHLIDEIKSGNDQQESRLHKIEEHSRNARRHLLEIKSPLLKMLNNMSKIPTSPISVPDSEDTGLADKESKREMMSLIEKISDNIQLLVDGNAKIGSVAQDEDKDKKIAIGPVALLAAGLAGIGAGIIGGYIKVLKAIFAPLTVHFDDLKAKTLAKIAESFKTLRTSISTKATSLFKAIIKPIIATFDKIKDGFKLAHISATEKLGVIFKPINFIFNSLGSMFKSLGSLFVPVTELFTFIKASATSAVGKVFAPIMKVVNTIKTIFKPIAAVFGKVSGIVGKIFAPLFVIMTIWDTVKGAMAGYEEDGIVGAIGGAVKGLINSLITVPLDMLTKATAWVLKKFGFDESAEALRSFSFTDEFNKIIDGLMANVNDLIKYFKDAWANFSFEDEFNKTIAGLKIRVTNLIMLPYNLVKWAIGTILGFFGKDAEAKAVKSFDLGSAVDNIFTSMFSMVTDAVNWIIDLFDFSKTGQILSDKFDSMKNIGDDILKSLIASVLPKRAEGDDMLSWLTNQIVDKAIPAGIYEWAGIDQSGTKLPPPIEVAKPDIGMGVDSGFRLALAQGESNQLKTERTSAFGSPIISNSTNQQNSVVNNNNIVSKIMANSSKGDKGSKDTTFKKRNEK